MKRRVNARFLVALVFAGLVGGAAVHFWRGYQVQRTAGLLLERATVEEEAGREVATVEVLRHYLSLKPDDVDALVRLVLILERSARSQAEREKVLAAFEQVLRRDPNRKDARIRLVRLAMEPDLRRYGQAGAHLRILLRSDPSDGEMEGRLGRCEEAAARYSEAAQLYERAIEHKPERLEPYGQLARLLRDRLDDSPKADQVMDHMIARNPQSFRAYLMRAEFRARSAPALAAEDIAHAASLAPDEADVILASAGAEPDVERARAILERGLSTFPGDSRIYRRLAGVESRAGRNEAAIAVIGRGLVAIPEDPDLRLARADAFILIGRRAEASQEIARLRKEGLPTPPLDLLAARMAIAAGLWREAADTLERLLPTLETVDPGARQELAIEANLRLAECYERLARPELRLAACRRVLAADPRHRGARMGHADALAQLGRVDEALAACRDMAAEWPEANLQVARLWIERNRALPESGRRWDEAEGALRGAEQAMPRSLPCTLAMAEIRAGQGRLKEADACLALAIQEHPDRVEPWLGRAAISERDGGPTAALAIIDEGRSRLGDRAEFRLARADRLGRIGDAPSRAALDRLEDGLDDYSEEDRDRLEAGLAEVRLRMGDRDGSRRLWGRLAARRPGDVNSRARLFDLALTEGDLAEAARGVSSLRQAEGSDGSLWRYAEASLALAQARDVRSVAGLNVARARLAEVTAKLPTWPRAAVLEGEIAEHLGDRNRASEAYQHAVELGERDPRIVGKLVDLLLEAGRLKDAGDILRRVGGPVSEVGGAARAAAELALREGNPARARELARRAVPEGGAPPAELVWLGEFLERAGEAAGAGAVLRNALDRSKDRPESWLALVRHLARVGRREEAALLAREAGETLKGEAAGPVLALCDEAVGAMEDAERRHREAVAARPDTGEPALAFGEFLVGRGRFQEALPVLRRAASLLDGQPVPSDRCRRALATALIATPEYRARREAIALLDRNLERGGTIEDHRLRALALASQSDATSEAMSAFAHLERLRPLAAEERLIAARLSESLGDGDAALAGFREAVRDRPKDPAALSSLAEALLHRGDLNAARATISQVEAIEPQSYLTAELQARMIAAEGKVEEATARLLAEARKPGVSRPRVADVLESWGRQPEAEAALRDQTAGPTQPGEALALARFLVRRDRPAEALDICESSWETSPADKVATICLEAASSKSAGDAERRRALDQVMAATAKSPDSKALLVRGALLQERCGDAGQAATLYRRALDRDPADPVVLNNLAWLLAVHDGKVDEAMAMIDKASTQVGLPPELLDTRAMAHLAARRPEPAIRDLESSLALRETPEGHFRLARARAMGRQFSDALRSLQKARELGFDAQVLTPLERPSLKALEDELARNLPADPPRAGDRISAK